MNHILSGIKVIELGTFVAAPSCAKILGEWGAEVIKIESPQKDPMRQMGALVNMPIDDDENVAFDQQNAHKKVIVIDVKTPKGQELIHRLLTDADVFVTNNRADALLRMGLSYEDLRQRYPKLVYAQILGYGELGPDKDKPGFDFTAFFARGGITGTLYEKGGTPMITVPALGDHMCGLALVGGICACLFKAARTGVGDKVTVSLMDTAIYGMAHMIVSSQYGKNSYPIKRKDNPNPLQVIYQTQDERLIQLGIAVYDMYFARFAKAINRPELLQDVKFNQFTHLATHQSSQELIGIIDDAMLEKTADEWVAIFSANDIPCEKAMLWEEILEDEQAWVNGSLEKDHYPSGDKIRVKSPIKIASAQHPQHQKAPKFGEHSQQILRDCGYRDDEIAKLYDDKIIF